MLQKKTVQRRFSTGQLGKGNSEEMCVFSRRLKVPFMFMCLNKQHIHIHRAVTAFNNADRQIYSSADSVLYFPHIYVESFTNTWKLTLCTFNVHRLTHTHTVSWSTGLISTADIA